MEMVLSSSLNSTYVVGAYIIDNKKKLLSSTPVLGRRTTSSTFSHFNNNNNNNNNNNTIIIRKQHQVRCNYLSLGSVDSITSASYGALLLAGGLFAYTRSGSKGSLYGGLAGSSLMAAAFVLMQSSETREIGDSLAFGSALLFTFVFGIRLAATRKIIPAGPLLALSMGASVVFISAYLQDSQSLM